MTRASGDGSLIAVVGMSCRLPRAPDLESYWRLLAGGEDAISAMPEERWEMAGCGVGEGLSEAGSGARFGAFLDHVDRFDPAFFGISPRDAESMDPQQRLALELSWEGLEDAGIAPSRLREGEVGVFMGAIASDYASLVQRCGIGSLSRYSTIGLHRSLVANRVSYALGLSGPSLTVDAAQSASLVAVHLACESLRKGESRLALAGGVHLNLDPHAALAAEKFGGLSPDGRCFTFDARANGYVRGEGGGVVVLKPLGDARADGDPVYCVIRGSAVNNDGGGRSLVTPSGPAHEALLRHAYKRAGLKRSDVQYVELHGSGTAVGDPIEAAALGAVLGSARGDEAPLSVGSAKTNIGHLEGAAGIAGLIKAALAVDRREIPASLNFERPNPEVPLEQLGLRVQAELGAWPRDDRPLIAGVSSFGVGGTNCHLVIAEEPPRQRSERERSGGERNGAAIFAASSSAPAPLALSAKTAPALRAQARRLAAHLGSNPELDPIDVAYSLATTRDTFEHRGVVLGGGHEELISGLAALGDGEPSSRVVMGRAASAGKPALLFPGYGSQWEGMALGLLDASPVFAGQIGACAEALEPYLDWSLEDVLLGADGAPPLDRPDVGQSALFAVTVSLAELWRSLGVEPSVVAGHSQGEIAAAYVAGGLSLDDAARVVVLRNRALTTLVGKGAMASVALSAEELGVRLERWEGRIEVAAINGPSSAVVSGEDEALDELMAQCAEDDVRARKVRGAVAPSHSAQVESLRERMLEELAPISPRGGEIPFHSTVTGEVLDTAGLDAEYWYRNARQTVLLEPVVRAMLDQGVSRLIEVSPHPILGIGLQEAIEAEGPGERCPSSAPCDATKAARIVSSALCRKPTPSGSTSTGRPSSPATRRRRSSCPPTPSREGGIGCGHRRRGQMPNQSQIIQLNLIH